MGLWHQCQAHRWLFAARVGGIERRRTALRHTEHRLHFTDLGFQCCWETSRGQPGTHAILTNFAGGDLGLHLNEGSLQERATNFISQVDQIYPGTLDSFTKQAVRQHWPSSPFVRGSYTCYKPGQYSTLANFVAKPVGNMFFAGEHTSVAFNGYLEGAVTRCVQSPD
ncbi:MAG: FAD-dependent oxidoreductase [Verrucomicrobia bacterium]|nr:MAG: FAD-dependent oxidoreductase [Verrucomicrobiota bacterium]